MAHQVLYGLPHRPWNETDPGLSLVGQNIKHAAILKCAWQPTEDPVPAHLAHDSPVSRAIFTRHPPPAHSSILTICAHTPDYTSAHPHTHIHRLHIHTPTVRRAPCAMLTKCPGDHAWYPGSPSQPVLTHRWRVHPVNVPPDSRPLLFPFLFLLLSRSRHEMRRQGPVLLECADADVGITWAVPAPCSPRAHPHTPRDVPRVSAPGVRPGCGGYRMPILLLAIRYEGQPGPALSTGP